MANVVWKAIFSKRLPSRRVVSKEVLTASLAKATWEGEEGAREDEGAYQLVLRDLR